MKEEGGVGIGRLVMTLRSVVRSVPHRDRRCHARRDGAPGTTPTLTVRITCDRCRGRWCGTGRRQNRSTQLSERCWKRRCKALRHEDWLPSHKFLHNTKIVTCVSVSGYLCDVYDHPLFMKKNHFFIRTVYYIG